MRRVWFHGAAAAALVCLLAGPVSADVTVSGDRAAYEELLAAFKKLFSLPGFRAKITGARGQGLIEFAAPDNYHLAIGGPQGYNLETIKVGNQVAQRGTLPGTTPGWRCRPARSGAKPLFNPAGQPGQQGSVTVSRGPSTVIEGTPVRTMFYTAEGHDKDTIYVGAQNGLPKRVIGSDRQTVDYYDYGAHVVITLPSCTP